MYSIGEMPRHANNNALYIVFHSFTDNDHLVFCLACIQCIHAVGENIYLIYKASITCNAA